MKFKEIAARITGISTPMFGVSWSAPKADVNRARAIVTFLQDRRVLQIPRNLTKPRRGGSLGVFFHDFPLGAVQSIQEIRTRLTQELEQIDHQSQLADLLRGMRRACRLFLSTMEESGFVYADGALSDRFPHEATFYLALGELRATMGPLIAEACIRYKIDVDDELAEILPLTEDSQSPR